MYIDILLLICQHQLLARLPSTLAQEVVEQMRLCRGSGGSRVSSDPAMTELFWNKWWKVKKWYTTCACSVCLWLKMKSTVTSPMPWFIINFTRHWCFKNHPKWLEKTAWAWPQQYSHDIDPSPQLISILDGYSGYTGHIPVLVRSDVPIVG